SWTSIFAIEFNFAGYLTAVNRALAGHFGPLLALTEATTQLPPPHPLGGGSALLAVVSCNEFSAPFNLRHNLAKRQADFNRQLAGLPPARSSGSPRRGRPTPHGKRPTSASTTPGRGSPPSCGRPTTGRSPMCPC